MTGKQGITDDGEERDKRNSWRDEERRVTRFFAWHNLFVPAGFPSSPFFATSPRVVGSFMSVATVQFYI